MFRKLVAGTAVIALAITAGSSAYAQIVTAPSVTLPDVTVQGQPAPGRTGPHYRVPAGYDADVAFHPYTSGIGPCTEGASPSQGCHHSTGTPIAPSHYEQPPFTR